MSGKYDIFVLIYSMSATSLSFLFFYNLQVNKSINKNFTAWYKISSTKSKDIKMEKPSSFISNSKFNYVSLPIQHGYELNLKIKIINFFFKKYF